MIEITDDMVERAAAALYKTVRNPKRHTRPWDRLITAMRDDFRTEAKRALDAALTPSKAATRYMQVHRVTGPKSMHLHVASHQR